LLPWLAFTIKGLEQGWLAQSQFKVTGRGIMFICGMHGSLVCWHIKIWLESGPVTADLTTTVIHTCSYSLWGSDQVLLLFMWVRIPKWPHWPLIG